MPHLILDVTANVAEVSQLSDILASLVEQFSEFETVNPASVKGYLNLRSEYVTGDGAAPGFIHLQVCVLAGRDEALRVRMADDLYSALQIHFADSLARNLAGLTLEVREMAVATYRK